MIVAHPRSRPSGVVATPLGSDRPGQARAALTEIDGRTVAWFHVGGSGEREAEAEAAVVVRAIHAGIDAGVPVLGVLDSLPVDAHNLGGLAAWGRVAHAATCASGVVPLMLAVTGPCHGGLATLIGLADHVVVAEGATAFVNGPRSVGLATAQDLDAEALGGLDVHARLTGLASLTAADVDDAVEALSDLLEYLPDGGGAPSRRAACTDPVDRPCTVAADMVPREARAGYDVRLVIADVVDRDSLLEVYAAHAPNLVTAYARIGGLPVAVIANQPRTRAGTLDIAASSKAARHVQGADSAGLPIITFVDTPGFEPGRDLEWRGMNRHGAELVHAYGAARVPRCCVVLRKAYGGAYIVMDSRDLGSDLVLAWPSAEIAVMGAPGAVAILDRRAIAEAADPDAARAACEDAYRTEYCTPRIAAERGYVDAVIEPGSTRAHLAAALGRLRDRGPLYPDRRHTNTPC